MNRLIAAIIGLTLAMAPVLGHAAPPTQAAPAPGPQLAAAPPPKSGYDSDTLYALDRAKSLRVWGGISLGTGLGLIATSGVLWMFRGAALRHADTRRFYPDEQRILDRARRRRVGAVVAMGIGVPMTFIGAGLLIGGAVWDNRARRRAAIVPVVTPRFAGASARIRF